MSSVLWWKRSIKPTSTFISFSHLTLLSACFVFLSALLACIQQTVLLDVTFQAGLPGRFSDQNTRAALKVMPPSLWCWPTMLEAGVGGTYPPVSCSILLPCNRWQQRGSLKKWCLKWQCEQSKGVELNSSTQTKWYPVTFINIFWMFMEVKQWLWAQWGGGWSISAVVTVTSVGADFEELSVQAVVHH